MTSGAAATGNPPDRPDDGVEPEIEELRLALALNGGVSLAVWMGGCAVELDRARRAHKGVTGEHRRVYDALCECFGRRLVVDILTGTSAGGINGALLGAAIAKDGRLDPGFVRDKWLELGDLSRLLQDQKEEAPTALMKGTEFHDDLKSTFEELLKTGPGPVGRGTSRPVVIPSLDVTMTDLIGVERRFRDAWGGELVAREHRPRFKFREHAHFTAEALAAAARTSASFPVAFDPWRITGNARILAGLPNQTYGMDGGLLDNAPIASALDLIPTRTSNSRVRRYACYLNGDPAIASEKTIGPLPALRDVAGHTINLPRTAPLVDHLYAIRNAVERPRWAELVQTQLLEMDLEKLQGVASALFGAYQERRTVQSLEELFDAPGDVAAVRELLRKTGGRLPWIPAAATPAPAPAWDWGVRPAQRIIHLLLDLLRPAVAAADPAARARLLTTRKGLDEQLTTLGDARDHVTRQESENNPSRFDEEAALERLQKTVTKAESQAPKARSAVEAAMTIFRTEAARTPELKAPAAVLFGTAEDEAGQVEHFFQRVLAIEVVRRAFAAEADIESAERLHFVQLTPAAPTPLFTSSPLDQQSPASVETKLTGVGLGHFAGFYRRSWRANDFMWGRLDAAARIVDLLLDAPSGEVGVGSTPSATETQVSARSACLARALLSTRLGEEGQWLIEEVLENAAGNAGSTVAEGSDPDAATATGEKPTPEQLQELVKETIEAELEAAGSRGSSRLPFTRAAFQRAAQLEIVREELEKVRDESAKDRELGSAAKVLELEAEEGSGDSKLKGEIKAVRAIYSRPGDSLPKRLTDPGEAASDLGLRTISHAALVGLSTVRTAGLPLSKVFGLVRTPLLAVAGAVAESRLYRATVAIGFWAAALYVTSRIVTTEQAASLEFETIWAPQTLTALVAVLGVLGVVAVPWLRAWRKTQPLRNAFFVVALLSTAGGVAAILALTAGDLDSVERLLFAPGSETPPLPVLLAPLVGLGVVSASRLPLPGWLTKLRPLLKFLSTGKPMCVFLILAFGVIGAWAGYTVADAIDGVWRAVAAALAGIGAPIAVFLAASLGKSRRKPGAGAASA